MKASSSSGNQFLPPTDATPAIKMALKQLRQEMQVKSPPIPPPPQPLEDFSMFGTNHQPWSSPDPNQKLGGCFPEDDFFQVPDLTFAFGRRVSKIWSHFSNVNEPESSDYLPPKTGVGREKACFLSALKGLFLSASSFRLF